MKGRLTRKCANVYGLKILIQKCFFLKKIGEYNFFYILKFEIFSVQTSKPDLKPDQVVLNRISDNGFYCYPAGRVLIRNEKWKNI